MNISSNDHRNNVVDVYSVVILKGLCLSQLQDVNTFFQLCSLSTFQCNGNILQQPWISDFSTELCVLK